MLSYKEFILESNIISANDMIDYVRNIHGKEEDFEEGDLEDRISNYSKYELKEINLNDYLEDGETRYYTDSSQVETYEEMINNGEEMSPIVVDKFGDILDGNHRAQAYYNLGIIKIKAYVGKG